MRAVVQDGYGSPDALRVRDIPRPAPKEGEILVRVRAASLHPDVWHVVTGLPFALRLMGSGVRRPKQPVPGTDMAGEVAALGPGATRFRVGDEVYGETLRGYVWRNGGAFAEYVVVPQDVVAPKPAGVTFEEAASVLNAGIITLINLPPDRPFATDQRVLVNGAGGGVGVVAVQMAAAAGARVTAVDTGAKLDLLTSLGADRVVDYTKDDLPGGPYDLIFDIVGNHRFTALRPLLAPDGRYVLVGHDQYGRDGRRWLGSIPRLLGLVARGAVNRQLPRPTVKFPPKGELTGRLSALLESGALKPVVDRAYPLDELPEAMRHLTGGTARGRIVITI
ncbi:NAD(P)-dependent alcohol dehydrogenase [Phytohabitans aurantiacus]|jgi:NADPH:quinone reductase-like Zn-dependent oxidoreductase|uniref:NADPH:quinone reductase n=1 Tax=Phytohabitans aurantiacus TaxID=3016789 RepID=A0ABQ5R5A6_9ACTN|nr:NAD(P)-dependent alcohol dehydrogenase [Phytohabitans aurantiacus]GLI01890.1 NADPH:quinone reductase [Phytohabitans aurantiacus]